ncbi:MAG: hypothetical protein EZS28_048567, partial [Streblomastix strix]
EVFVLDTHGKWESTLTVFNPM